MRETLPEAVEQGAHLTRHRGYRRVVAHRAGGFGLQLGDHLEHGLAFFARKAIQLLIAAQFVSRQRLGRQRRIDQIRFEIAHTGAQPIAIRCALAINLVDVRIVQ
jgi:hypothetical protein